MTNTTEKTASNARRWLIISISIAVALAAVIITPVVIILEDSGNNPTESDTALILGWLNGCSITILAASILVVGIGVVRSRLKNRKVS